MSFSREWEDRFREGSHRSSWPWSDLVSYVHRHASPKRGFCNVLEVGCGVGANIPFFRSLEVDYHAVEGSPSAVDTIHRRFPDMADKVKLGDFTSYIPFDAEFDLIVDRSAMTCNSTESMERGLSLVAEKLRPGGRYIAIDWFSKEHTDSNKGREVDAYTRTDIPGPSHLQGLGPVHFCDHNHIFSLLEGAGLTLTFLEHKTNAISYPETDERRAWWNLVAHKQ